MVSPHDNDEEVNAPDGILSSPPLRRSRRPAFWHNKRYQTWIAVLTVLVVFLGLFGGTDKVKSYITYT